MSELRGLSTRWASLFGMPHVGAHYDSYRTGSYSLDDDACCSICGYGRPLNTHHVVNRGIRQVFDLRGHELRSPLWCLCGSGTTGCHGAVHNNDYGISWEWDSEELEDAWWSGEILKSVEPHSPELWDMGQYVIEGPDWRMSLGGDGYQML